MSFGRSSGRPLKLVRKVVPGLHFCSVLGGGKTGNIIGSVFWIACCVLLFSELTSALWGHVLRWHIVSTLFAELYKCKSRKVARSLPEDARELASRFSPSPLAHIAMPWHHHLVLQKVCQLVFEHGLQLVPRV